jgi:hypothetical protein
MSTHSQPQMLCYDKKNLFNYEGPMTEEVADLMGDDLKIFARAEYHIPTRKLTLTKRVADQSW